MQITKEQLVCTKEQAMIFKYKGVTQHSIFAWIEQSDEFGKLNLLDDNTGIGFAAFTAPELMDLLPKMNYFQRILFIIKTGMNPVKIADHLIKTGL